MNQSLTSSHWNFDLAEMTHTLRQRFGARVRLNEPLARHGTFGVGGPADAWLAIDNEGDLIDLVSLAAGARWPLMLVGNGTNLLYTDAGVRGIVVQNALSTWALTDLGDGTAQLVGGAGVNLPKLVNDLAAQGWGGLEWGAGVPGSLGGAVISNAGAHGSNLSDTLQSARILDTHNLETGPQVHDYPLAVLQMAYRDSRFRARRRVEFDNQGRPLPPPRALIEPAEIVTSVTCRLRREAPETLKARVAHYKQHRKETQPPQASAGSVFKNPPGDYSGRLIEAAGLKGKQIGKAQLSSRHANFIVNLGGARAADILALIALARATVRERFGVELELEIELRGETEAETP
ncbi:MAG TPA: UDP-N-acetylmuramate dehydrogenase [Ktedonobacterales bacterium]|jgi:UDP-N-acetylmuramate dehydrogenase